jgi:hypothetical protein
LILDFLEIDRGHIGTAGGPGGEVAGVVADDVDEDVGGAGGDADVDGAVGDPGEYEVRRRRVRGEGRRSRSVAGGSRRPGP